MKILLTAFEPFDNLPTNSSLEVFKQIDDPCIIKKELPVSYTRARDMLKSYIEEIKPDFVINLGQAGGETMLRIEKVALNYTRARIADNDNVFRSKGEVIEGEEFALQTCLEIEDIVDEALKENVPSYISLSAGGYICNTVYYTSLFYNHSKALFIHLPYFTNQLETEKAVDLDILVKNTKYYIECIKKATVK